MVILVLSQSMNTDFLEEVFISLQLHKDPLGGPLSVPHPEFDMGAEEAFSTPFTLLKTQKPKPYSS